MAALSSVQILATSKNSKAFIRACESLQAENHSIDYLSTDKETGNTALHIALQTPLAFDPEFVIWYVTKAPEVLGIANAKGELPLHILASREPNKTKISHYKVNCATMMEQAEHLEARTALQQTPRAIAIKLGNRVFLEAERQHCDSHKSQQQSQTMLMVGEAMAFTQLARGRIKKLGTEYISMFWGNDTAISFNGAALTSHETAPLKTAITHYQFRLNQREPIGTDLRDLLTQIDGMLESGEPIRAVEAFQLTTLLSEDLIRIKNALDVEMGFRPKSKLAA